MVINCFGWCYSWITSITYFTENSTWYCTLLVTHNNKKYLDIITAKMWVVILRPILHYYDLIVRIKEIAGLSFFTWVLWNWLSLEFEISFLNLLRMDNYQTAILVLLTIIIYDLNLMTEAGINLQNRLQLIITSWIK